MAIGKIRNRRYQHVVHVKVSPPTAGRPISSPSIILPGDPGNPVTEYPEG